MQKLAIETASDEQLTAFAKDVQQLDELPKNRAGVIAALITSGWDKDYIMVPGAASANSGGEPLEFDEPLAQDEPAGPVAAKMPLTGFSFWKDAPMVTCRILPTDRAGGNEPAYPSINGSPPMVIQRNKLVEIPWDFYLVLKQAGGTKLLPGALPSDDLIPQDYSEYPLTDVKLPTRAAVDAWKKKTGEIELGRPKAIAA